MAYVKACRAQIGPTGVRQANGKKAGPTDLAAVRTDRSGAKERGLPEMGKVVRYEAIEEGAKGSAGRHAADGGH